MLCPFPYPIYSMTPAIDRRIVWSQAGTDGHPSPALSQSFTEISSLGLRPCSAGSSAQPSRSEAVAGHKNLYVLNLPLDVTTDQLAGLFGRYGTVVHCVILAMLDAQARRRGFIDMAQSSEAKEAIEGLNGFVWHGYPIEVSYAIVQRSGGPFDQAAGGRNLIKRNVPRNRFNTGPRRVPSDSSLPGSTISNPSSTQEISRPLSRHSPCPPSPGFSESSCSSSDGCHADCKTIIITNIDSMGIKNDTELRSMAQGFGTVTQATVHQDPRIGFRWVGIAAFAGEHEADMAIRGLDGRIFNGQRLAAYKLRESNRAGLGEMEQTQSWRPTPPQYHSLSANERFGGDRNQVQNSVCQATTGYYHSSHNHQIVPMGLVTPSSALPRSVQSDLSTRSPYLRDYPQDFDRHSPLSALPFDWNTLAKASAENWGRLIGSHFCTGHPAPPAFRSTSSPSEFQSLSSPQEIDRRANTTIQPGHAESDASSMYGAWPPLNGLDFWSQHSSSSWIPKPPASGEREDPVHADAGVRSRQGNIRQGLDPMDAFSKRGSWRAFPASQPPRQSLEESLGSSSAFNTRGDELREGSMPIVESNEVSATSRDVML